MRGDFFVPKTRETKYLGKTAKKPQIYVGDFNKGGMVTKKRNDSNGKEGVKPIQGVEKSKKLKPNILWKRWIIRFVKKRDAKIVEIIQSNLYNNGVYIIKCG